MGLATVYGIVKQSGGNIHVYSEPGKGTTFRIYFPAVEAAAGSGTGTGSGTVGPGSPVREEEEGTVGAGRTILVVEDEDGVRGFLRTSLEGRGFRILEARDGETALEMASRGGGPIHLLLTDMVLPNMSGKSLMEKVTALHGDLRTLFIYGYGAGAGHQHGVSDERTAFLQKPFGADALLAAVIGALSPARLPFCVTVPS
jgi:two-component system cell cycle sensor histidine kinase/response regulator CckA